MTDLSYWHNRNRTIFNSVGVWHGGDDVTIEGYSLMNELMGNVSYMQLHILNATGKLVEKNIADWIELSLMGLSYPDSRIWCNQMAAYCADTNASVVAAANTAILAADSRAYGGSQTSKIGMCFLLDAFDCYESGQNLSQILAKVKFKKGKPIIVGFARPIDRDDERLKPFIAIQNKLGIPDGKYLNFAKELSAYLDEHYNLSINCGGYMSAFLLDQGFTPEQGYNINAFCVISGAVACYRDLSPSAANSYLPQKCIDIEYIGIKPRSIR